VVDAELKAAQDFADEHKLTIPAISAPRGTNALLLDYQATSTPSYTLIDQDGTVMAAGLLMQDVCGQLGKERAMPDLSLARYSVAERTAE
jgi:hypothetical protein